MLDAIKDSGSPAVDLTYSSVRGRLRTFVDFWRTLEVSQFIFKVTMQGYKIPFCRLNSLTPPNPCEITTGNITQYLLS